MLIFTAFIANKMICESAFAFGLLLCKLLCVLGPQGNEEPLMYAQLTIVWSQFWNSPQEKSDNLS